MDEGAYSNPAIVAAINDLFVPIKVDNDRHPDINARYNMGGWPSTVFLTPDGAVLYGETYVPPERMLGVVKYIADYYAANKAEIAGQIEAHRVEKASMSPSELTAEIPASVVAAIDAGFDPRYGGFGSAPKFPHAEAILFAIEHGGLEQVVDKTLEGMSAGGMYDRFAGGFFRYSTTADWSIPHFEKMLQDNAQLSSVCLMACSATGNERWRSVALDVHRWLLAVMRDPETGTFAGSQDADGEESYYRLPLTERAKRPTPYIDRTVYADWNALAASSLVSRYKLTGEGDILEAARQGYAFVTERLEGRHYYANGEASGTRGLLGDAAALCAAATDLAEATGDGKYLADARRFADSILDDLTDAGTGAFFDRPAAEDALGALARGHIDFRLNSDACYALLRLSLACEEDRYRLASAKRVKISTPNLPRK